MTAGMTGDGIVGTIAGNEEKSTGAFATDLTADGETLAGTGVLTSMAAASIATVTVITVKDSAEAIFKPIVNLPATIEIDGNRLNAYSEAVKQRTKKPLAEKSAAF